MEQNPQGLLGRYHSKLAFVHRIADALVIMLVLRVSAASYGIVWGERYVIAGVLAILPFHIFGESMRLHRPWSDNPAGEFLRPIVFAWAPTALGLVVFAWSMKVTADYSRVAIGLWMISTPLALTLWRVVLHSLFRTLLARGPWGRRVAIVGANDHGERLAEVVMSTPSLGSGWSDSSTTSSLGGPRRQLVRGYSMRCPASWARRRRGGSANAVESAPHSPLACARGRRGSMARAAWSSMKEPLKNSIAPCLKRFGLREIND